MNVNDALTGKLFIIYHALLCSFQGRMGRKGFPGKVGPEGVTVSKDSIHICIFFPLFLNCRKF